MIIDDYLADRVDYVYGINDLDGGELAALILSLGKDNDIVTIDTVRDYINQHRGLYHDLYVYMRGYGHWGNVLR